MKSGRDKSRPYRKEFPLFLFKLNEERFLSGPYFNYPLLRFEMMFMRRKSPGPRKRVRQHAGGKQGDGIKRIITCDAVRGHVVQAGTRYYRGFVLLAVDFEAFAFEIDGGFRLQGIYNAFTRVSLLNRGAKTASRSGSSSKLRYTKLSYCFPANSFSMKVFPV